MDHDHGEGRGVASTGPTVLRTPEPACLLLGLQTFQPSQKAIHPARSNPKRLDGGPALLANGRGTGHPRSLLPEFSPLVLPMYAVRSTTGLLCYWLWTSQPASPHLRVDELHRQTSMTKKAHMLGGFCGWGSWAWTLAPCSRHKLHTHIGIDFLTVLPEDLHKVSRSNLFF